MSRRRKGGSMLIRTVIVELEIEAHGEGDAFDVVDRVLDNGAFQDAIHEYGEDMGPPVRVVSAIAVLRNPDAIPVKRIPPCAVHMGCLCWFHANGGDVDGPCDATERP